MDFDEDRIYYSHQNLQVNRNENDRNNNEVEGVRRGDDDFFDEENVDMGAVRRHFREFLRNYRQGAHKYTYREKLLRMHRRSSGDEFSNPGLSAGGGVSAMVDPNAAHIEVDLAHVGEYDSALFGLLLGRPADVIPHLEAAASDALRSLLFDSARGVASSGRRLGEEEAEDEENEQKAAANGKDAAAFSVQVLLRGNLAPTHLRSIQSQHMNTLVKCPGIVISSSPVRSRAHKILIRCSRCGDERTISATSGPFGGVSLPQRCQRPRHQSNPNGGDSGGDGDDQQECGAAPYGVVPDECQYVDQQTLKLQESPESVPTGEMPRSLLLAVERTLVDRAPPGTRVSVLAVPSLFHSATLGNKGGPGAGRNVVRTVYLRVVGMHRDTSGGDAATFTPREEEAFTLLARRSDVYQILSRSIAPSISGSYTVDIKKALTCMLFGGSRKRLPDGMKLRGDVNVLLLGDPSTAKSQFLKFTTRVAPVGVYTSGKGSSAAGLTASVVRDSRGEFYLEGGAMVLADGGIVGIDEFDKMRPDDRVAIHEAMEQQTISVAKAGITTVLNSRSSVLAAANPVFGRYDDLKSASENIDLMTTILSRFDLIFLVRDVRDEERDLMICRHVMGVHINSSSRSHGGGDSNMINFNASFGGGEAGSSGDGVVDKMAGDGSGTNAMSLGGVDFGDSLSGDNSTPETISENAMRVAMTGRGELDVPTMRKYIQYCKSRCSPRLGEEAGDMLASSYVKIRDDVRNAVMESRMRNENLEGSQSTIPITVRQLEALVRISESLAKMRLESEVRPADVAEALRLFKVSTMAANAADQGAASAVAASSSWLRSGANGNNSDGNNDASSMVSAAAASRDEMMRTETFLKSRLRIGALLNKQRIMEEATSQGHDAVKVARVIAIMVMRGEVQERNQSRLIKRIK